jgi:hypothetical protein
MGVRSLSAQCNPNDSQTRLLSIGLFVPLGAVAAVPPRSIFTSAYLETQHLDRFARSAP